jgi:hypothetical protein
LLRTGEVEGTHALGDVQEFGGNARIAGRRPLAGVSARSTSLRWRTRRLVPAPFTLITTWSFATAFVWFVQFAG